MSTLTISAIPIVENMAEAMAEAHRLIETGQHGAASALLAQWTAGKSDAEYVPRRPELSTEWGVLRGFISAHCPFPLLKQDGPMLDIATAFSIRAMRTLAQLPPAQAQEVLLASCYLSTFGVCLVSPEQAPGPSGPVH